MRIPDKVDRALNRSFYYYKKNVRLESSLTFQIFNEASFLYFPFFIRVNCSMRKRQISSS